MTKLKQALDLLAAFTCLGAALYIFLDAGLPAASGTSRGIETNYMARVGAPAPPFALRTVSNELESFQRRAGQVTILNFWSTSCSPCRREMRELQRLLDHHPDMFRILAINMAESRDSVAAWRDHLGLTYDLLLDPVLSVAQRYQVRGIPTTFLLDDRLTIQAVYYGPVTYDQVLGDAQRLAHRI